MQKVAFISHSCSDHEYTSAVAEELGRSGIQAVVDPFQPGDRTARKVQQSVKSATHFVLLATETAVDSPWVSIESKFAKLCQRADAICIVPVRVATTEMLSAFSNQISIRWSTDDGLALLAEQVREAIAGSQPAKRLAIDEGRSEGTKERARRLERQHANTDDESFLHQAVQVYGEAIDLDFANHNAWANRAWALWKIGEKETALSDINFAMQLHPTGHVKDVHDRVKAGRYTIR